jgi:glucose-1-phosphate thymidylyltransferase
MLKGVILAGGKGTRLAPLTEIVNKHCLPVYDKPMIMYPLNTLKSLGIKDILIVTGGEHIGSFAEFLGDGAKFDVSLTYKVQNEANGIAGALALAEDFAGGNRVAVILGDNIFGDLNQIITQEKINGEGPFFLFAKVIDPRRFGVPIWEGFGAPSDEFKDKVLVGIEEKPKEYPKYPLAVTGFYVYPPSVFDVIKTIKPSARGELEITDVNNFYIKETKLWIDYAFTMDVFWSDAGTHESLLESANWARNNTKIF